MLEFLWNFGSFVIALSILVAAHEYGHFFVARRCGVKVERFSIGFGKPLWKRIGQDGTEYVIALIPLGGYVKMLDERVEDVPEHLLSQAFNRKNVWQRIAIVVAGPLANFIFAVFALYLMYLIGVPAIKPVIESTLPNTPASVISLQQPTKISAVSGQTVRNWEETSLAIVSHIGEDELELSLVPIDAPIEGYVEGLKVKLDISQWNFDPEKASPITALGLNIYRPKVVPTFAMVTDDGAAAAGGVKLGDTVVAYNGQAYTDWTTLVKVIQASANKPLRLMVKRDGEQLELELYPKPASQSDGKVVGVIGVSPTQTPWPDNMQLRLEYGFWDALGVAADKTWQLTSVSLKMIGKLFTGDVSVKNLSGPISIAQGAGNSAAYSFVAFLSFLALISVNLGIINLLPLPILDGGHLVYYLIEVFTGRAVPEKVQEIGFRFGAALLLVMMSIALFNDFSRL